MRGVDLAAKARNVSRALGVEVELRDGPIGRTFWVFCPELDTTFTETFLKASRAEAALRAIHERVYHARGEFVYEWQGKKCCFCGRHMAKDGYEIDHIVPRSKGRDDRVSNIQCCCSGFGGCDGHRRKHGG